MKRWETCTNIGAHFLRRVFASISRNCGCRSCQRYPRREFSFDACSFGSQFPAQRWERDSLRKALSSELLDITLLNGRIINMRLIEGKISDGWDDILICLVTKKVRNLSW